MYKHVREFVSKMLSFCPEQVLVHSNESVSVQWGIGKQPPSAPLFTVDLKFVNATAESPAKFIYSTPPETLFASLTQPFDTAFKTLQSILRVERRVMKKLFWAYDPVVRLPHAGEDWAKSLKSELVEGTKRSLFQPMQDYLNQLGGFMDLIAIEPVEYAASAESKFCPATENAIMDLPALAALATRRPPHRLPLTPGPRAFTCLPSLVIVGAQKSGSTALTGYLLAHPAYRPSVRKEVHAR
jgi:hypothetical protein